MTKIFCEHCGKDITNENTAYVDIDLLDDVFGDTLYDTGRSERYFGKKYVSFDLCQKCFDELKDRLFLSVSDFLKGEIKDDNN